MDGKRCWHWIRESLGRILHNPKEYRLLFFYIASIVWLELIYRLCTIKSLSVDFAFPVLFAFPAGGVLYLLSRLFAGRFCRIASIFLMAFAALSYMIQLIYFSVFKVPLSLYSMTGAGDAAQFSDVVLSAVTKNLAGVLLLFIPPVLLAVNVFKLQFSRMNPPVFLIIVLFCLLAQGIALLSVKLTGDGYISQYTLYYKTYSPELSAGKLGLLTTVRLDLERLILGNGEAVEAAADVPVNTARSASGGTEEGVLLTGPEVDGSKADGSETSGSETNTPVKTGPDAANAVVAAGSAAAVTPVPTAEAVKETPFNVLDIDFPSLISKEKDPVLLEMHKYFSTAAPTKKNAYTGIFKGCNLILITAEGFSPYAVDSRRTPTLYRMIREGFEFENFYNPIWGVSTSDGEYVACTGLIPKEGVWSFARSGVNRMPFVMGNQFKKLGYLTKAWHDHTYTYYKRNISHPNMGYDFKGVGNGLNIKKTWPESDVEMIEATSPEYIGKQPFHIYYMTVSGHLQYNFGGNYIAKKNKKLVDKLGYSNASKAYIACNLELEFAMKLLVRKLEAAGIAGNTVIAISPDHYPYGLPRESIDELAGHKVENSFELYKSTFILWKKGMKPVTVEKPCSSLDINPTLANLFGLEYDSRLVMGRDILSDTAPLVIFSNRSWITDRARFNSIVNKTEFTGGAQKDPDYARRISKIVSDRFKFSTRILEKDYYKEIDYK